MDSTQPWFRNAVHFYDDPAVMETGLAWAWPFVLSALKASRTFGVVPSRALSDAVIYGRAQLPLPSPRGYTLRDAFAAVGLLVPAGEPDTWTTPNWRDYQPDPTSSERVRAWRERNRAAEEEARRRPVPAADDGPGEPAKRPVTVTNGSERSVTPDGTGRDGTDQTTVVEDPHVVVREPVAAGAAGDEPPGGVKPPTVADQAAEVFAHWVAVFGKTGPASKRSTAVSVKRLGHVTARMRDGYSVADLKVAIDGCAKSPWHRGQNPDGKVYDDLSMIMSPSKVDRFIQDGRQEGRPRTTPPVQPQPAVQRTHHAAGLHLAHGAERPDLVERPAGRL